MISPAKAITAGAFVFALGGAFLIAQPFDQHEGGVPGAEPGDALAATSVTGTIAWASSCASPTVTSVEGKMQERGAGCIDRMVTSDDTRLAGTSEISWNKDIHVTDDGRRRAIRSMSENIRASGGGWVCRTPAVLDEGTGHFHTPAQGTDLYTCIGDGANAGLMSILIVDTRADGSRSDPFEGLIFPGELPPAPEIAAAD